MARRVGSGWVGTAAVAALAVMVPVLSANALEEGERYDPPPGARGPDQSRGRHQPAGRTPGGA